MFASASVFNCELSGWDVSSGTNFHEMFLGASVFNGDLSGLDVSSGTYFEEMFYYASAYNADISRWDVSSGKNFAYIFEGAESFKQDLRNWPERARHAHHFCTNGVICDYVGPSSPPSFLMTPSSKLFIWPSSTPSMTTSSKALMITSIIFITVVIFFFYKKLIKKHMHIVYEEAGPYDDSNEGVELMSQPYTALDDQANSFEGNPTTQTRIDDLMETN